MPRADGSKWLLRASVALPLAMLAANLLAWLRWGTDLPYFDDWLAYDQGTSLSLSPRHLFQAINNTISPVGLTLDVLAQRGLGGNPLPYQTLSMLGVLGGLLALQWRLLGWAMRDTRAQAVLFGFCFLMLQSGSYWGEQNLAYHQALPLLALLGAACLALPAGAGGAWRVTAVFGLGLLAGLSYISGAIAALVMGVSWVLLGWVLRRQPARALAWRVRCHGAALLLAGTLTSALQIVLTRGVEQKRDHQYMGLTWPDRVDFWAYLAGKIGRSTGHAFASMALEVLWVVLLTVAVVAATALALRGLGMFGGVGRARLRRWALVFIPLSGVVLSYLLIVSLGRAGLRDPSIQGAGPVFEFAYLRFHFFWVTPLLPWLAAAVVGWRRWAQPAAAALLVLACALGLVRGVFDVPAFYRSASAFRVEEIRCLDRQLGAGEPIRCKGFSQMGLPDLTRAFVHARDIQASFVRYFPIVGREGFGRTVLHWQGADGFKPARWVHARAQSDGWMRGEDDPQMIATLPDADRLSHCRVLGVQLSVQARQADTVQVFYRLLGQAGYGEAQSVRRPYDSAGDAPVRLEFSLDSPTGFEPELRVDPVDGPGGFRVSDLRVTCRLLAPQ